MILVHIKIDTEQQDLDHTANPRDILKNKGNIDPDSDHIMIRISGVKDSAPNNSTIDENPVADPDDDNLDDIVQTGV